MSICVTCVGWINLAQVGDPVFPDALPHCRFLLANAPDLIYGAVTLPTKALQLLAKFLWDSSLGGH